MAEGQRPGNDSLLDMEKELTCSVSAELTNGWGHTPTGYRSVQTSSTSL